MNVFSLKLLSNQGLSLWLHQHTSAFDYLFSQAFLPALLCQLPLSGLGELLMFFQVQCRFLSTPQTGKFFQFFGTLLAPLSLSGLACFLGHFVLSIPALIS